MAVRPRLMGPEMPPLGRVKTTAAGPGQRTNVGHLAVLANEVAGLERTFILGGGLLQVIEHLGAVVELVQLVVEKLRQLLLAVVGEQVLLVLGEDRGRGPA